MTSIPHNNHPEAGFSLVEILIAVVLTSFAGFAIIKVFDLSWKMDKRLAADATSETEALGWMTFLRTNFYNSLLNADAPPEYPQLHKIQAAEAGFQTVKYNYQLSDTSYKSAILFQIKNKCTPVPSVIRPMLPTLSDNYLAKVLNNLGANPACLNDLTSLNCGPGQTVSAQLLPGGGPSIARYFPRITQNSTVWKNPLEESVAGLVCVLQTAYNYTHVQLFSATFNSEFMDQTDKSNALRWTVKKLIFPPPRTGDSQYVR